MDTVIRKKLDERDPDQVLLHLVCAILPGPHIGLDELAAALQWDRERLGKVVEALAGAGFLDELADEEIVAQPDLVRADALLRAEKRFAGERGRQDREALLRRHFRACFRRILAANGVVHPRRRLLEDPGPQDEVFAADDEGTTSVGKAIAWWDRDRRVVYAAAGAAVAYGWHDDLWRLAEAVWGLYLQTRDHHDFLGLCGFGLEAAEQCGNRIAAARMHQQLEFVYHQLDQRDRARQHGRAAYTIGREEHHAPTLATAESRLGRDARADGDWQAAHDYYDSSAALHRAMEPPSERGYWMNRARCGEMLIALGRDDEALAALTGAADYMARIGDIDLLAQAVIPLAAAHAGRGDADTARALLTDVLDRAERHPARRAAQQVRHALDDLADLRDPAPRA